MIYKLLLDFVFLQTMMVAAAYQNDISIWSFLFKIKSLFFLPAIFYLSIIIYFCHAWNSINYHTVMVVHIEKNLFMIICQIYTGIYVHDYTMTYLWKWAHLYFFVYSIDNILPLFLPGSTHIYGVIIHLYYRKWSQNVEVFMLN